MFLIPSSSSRPHPIFLFLLLQVLSARGSPHALSMTPSSTWYGDDGSWSAISLRVGSPQQWVDVMVNTASSETWVVSPFGCDGSSACQSKRGGLFDSRKSSTWQSQGSFELGLDPQLGFTGAGDYGLDILEFGSAGVSINKSMIASINDTQYWLGHLGLGINPANFTNVVTLSPISELVEHVGSIPSHSYGFTAGAIYQGKSEPCSLTLGGFDANRFIPHNFSFELNPHQQPQAFVQSISLRSGSGASVARNWSSNPLQLLEPLGGIFVVIDSSTPFLWLPESVCESFSQALGLTYNDSLALYTFDGNASRRNDLQKSNLAFTFSLSDTSQPSQIVNITLPYAAFDLQLSFPSIPNTTYGDTNSNKYYFPLRRAANDTQYTIGRAFLQEAYIVTDYERNNFSVYQAVHIADPLGNTSITDITRPSTSRLSDVGETGTSSGLSRTAVILIIVGAVLVLVLVASMVYLYFRNKRRSVNDGSNESNESNEGDKSGLTPASPLAISKDLREPHLICEVDGVNIIPPAEIAADDARYELAGPQAPMELDSRSIPTSDRIPERHPESISERSPREEISVSYRSSDTNIYSAVSSPESTIVNYSSLSPPPPGYRTLSEIIEQPRETAHLQGHIYGRHRRFGTGKARANNSGDDVVK